VEAAFVPIATAISGENECRLRAAFNPCLISNSRLTAGRLLSGSKHLADSPEPSVSEA
jgi:hypothetical protein